MGSMGSMFQFISMKTMQWEREGIVELVQDVVISMRKGCATTAATVALAAVKGEL